MIDIAIKYEEQLKEKFRSVWFADKYKYWNCANFYEDWKVKESTWMGHEFVSVDVANNNVLGYVGYSIDRSNDLVYGLNIINFTDSPAMFGIDLGETIQDIFEKYHFRKLCFSVVVGNPIEHTYDKLCEKYGGRVVGVQKSHVRLIDGQFYDEKLYEISADDYMRKCSKEDKVSGDLSLLHPETLQEAATIVRNEFLKHGEWYEALTKSILAYFEAHIGKEPVSATSLAEGLAKQLIGDETDVDDKVLCDDIRFDNDGADVVAWLSNKKEQ